MTEIKRTGGFPLKISATIVIVVFWNVLFLIDFLNFFRENRPVSSIGYGAQFALGFMLLTCILLLTFEPARRLILKEGRTISEINKLVYFVMFISGFMLLITLMKEGRGQTNVKFKVDASKVKKITIINKVHYSPRNYKRTEVIVKDPSKIAEIVNSFAYSEEIPRSGSAVKSSYGFFEMEFYEGNKNFYYTIDYTIYDGVIIANMNGGNHYKNRRLEILISKLFVD